MRLFRVLSISVITNEKPFFEIRRGDRRLGTLSLQVLHDHVRFGEFYLFPKRDKTKDRPIFRNQMCQTPRLKNSLLQSWF